MFSLIVCRFWFVIRQLFDKTVNNRLCLSFLCHHIICIVQCKSSKKVLNEKTIYKELTKDEKHKAVYTYAKTAPGEENCFCNKGGSIN